MKQSREKKRNDTIRHYYGLYFAGQNVMYFLPSLFLSAYLLMCGVDASLTAAALVLVKIWDAVNDCIFGRIIDKVHFKKGGRFLPWVRISVLPIGITTIALFCIPECFTDYGKIVWFVAAYVLWDTAYTICDTPAYALVTTLTSNQKERTHLMATARIYANIGMVAAVVLGNVLTSEAVGISFSSAVFGGTIFAIISMSFICIKGRETVCYKEKQTEEKSYTLKEMLWYLKENKYLRIYYVGAFFQLGLNTTSIVAMFACFYYFHSALLAAVFTGLSYAPAVIMGFFLPKLLKRYGKYFVFMGANIIYAVVCVLICFIGPRFVPHLVLNVIRGIAYSINSLMMFMFTPDCAEYGQYKTGIDARGITFAVQTFTQKLNSAVASALGVGILGVFGWVSIQASDFAELAEMNVVQSTTALQGLWISYTLLPALGAVIAVFIWSKYRLRDEKDIELMTKCNIGEISRQECENSLSCGY